MKRIYFCIGIALATLLLIAASGTAMREYSGRLQRQLDAAGLAAAQQDMEAAAALLETCITQAREAEHLLAVFVRRESLAELDETLSAALCFARMGNEEETQAELARAGSQLYSMSHLFFSML